MQDMDAPFCLATCYITCAQGWIMLKPLHFRTFTFCGVGGIKKNLEHGGLVLFVLTEMSKGLTCRDNLLSYVQLLQHKENSLPSRWHTLH